MEMSYFQVIRSQRNRQRNTVSTQDYELTQRHRRNASYAANANELDLEATASLNLVNPNEYLGYFSTSALILNQMFGTGIYVTPAVVLSITNSKSTSLLLWLFGGLVTWAGLGVYLEYGIRFPLTGGELHYIDFVWTYPKLLLPYMYSLTFMVLSGSQGNALVFGKAVILASTPEGTFINPRLQKLFAIVMMGLVCLLQAYSRINYVRFNNLFAVYKIMLLTTLTVTGWCALGGKRSNSAALVGKPYGPKNLDSDFGNTVFRPYEFALALLAIFKVYLGYENANFVLEEVRRPPGDEARVYRRAAKITVLGITFFYLMINLAFFAACSTNEMTPSSDILALFFTNVFGPSPRARKASGIIQSISACGNMMSYTFSNVRVKQEIARLGITPYPEFWARTTQNGTPGPALLLAFIFTSIMILATPLSDANGYLVISTLFAYVRTWIGLVLGIGLLAAPWLRAFNKPWHPSFNGSQERWRPLGSRLGFCSMVPLTLIFLASNLFVLVFMWWPSSLQQSLHTKAPIVPSVVSPMVGTLFLVAGAVYWLWDLHILRWFGYTSEALAERQEGVKVQMCFHRRIDGPALVLYKSLEKLYHFARAVAKSPPDDLSSHS